MERRLRELRVKCLDCGSEDFTVHQDFQRRRTFIVCDGCGAGDHPEKESCERDFRQEELHEALHAPTQKGRVYFISSEAEDAPIKIGYTTSEIDNRIKALQTGHPHKLTVLAEMDGSYRLEHALQRIFAGQKIYGEWFKRSRELTDLINALSER
jgi:hypothetical protein